MTPAAKASPAPVLRTCSVAAGRSPAARSGRLRWPRPARREVHHREHRHTALDHAEGHRIQAGQSTGPSTVGTGASTPVSAPAFEFVDHDAVEVRQAGQGNLGDAVWLQADQFQVGVQAADCARCRRADQPLPPSGRQLSMTGWMPGAPACRIRAPEVCRSAVEASNSALAPLWSSKYAGRRPARSSASVNDVAAPVIVRTPVMLMSSRAHSARMKAACTSSPTAPSTPIGKVSPEHSAGPRPC